MIPIKLSNSLHCVASLPGDEPTPEAETFKGSAQALMEATSNFGVAPDAATIRRGDMVRTAAAAAAEAIATSNAPARPRALLPSSTEPIRTDKSERFAIARAGDL